VGVDGAGREGENVLALLAAGFDDRQQGFDEAAARGPFNAMALRTILVKVFAGKRIRKDKG
jgi:hypothetical protein